MADGCVFCRILKGELPSEKIAESARTVTILDIGPVNPGHALVVAKEHVELLAQAPADLAAELLAQVQKIAPAIVKATGADGYNMLNNNGRAAGQLVPHLHFHIIPRLATDGIKFGWRQKKYGEGEAAAVGAKIRTALG